MENSFSFFEMTVGMAFDYFAKEAVDIAVIEVGLGGRLDSTNIIVPEISLITNIGYDHMDILGDTLDKIAFEKAGIIKKNVPVVVSELQPEIAWVFKQVAEDNNSELTFASELSFPEYKTSLAGAYQKRNVKGVLATLDRLPGYSINGSHIEKGLLNVQLNTGLQGRWQQLGSDPKIICDTAHNKDGLLLVLDQLLKEKYHQLHLVLGFVKEKNLDDILPLFPQNAKYYFCKPNIPRGLDPKILAETAKKYKLRGTVYSSVSKAYKAAKKHASKEDLIFVGGSTFVVAEVL